MSAHSIIGPSSAERWWNCPGSVALTASMPNRPNKYAVEGTLAHSIAQIFVEGKITTLQLYERIGEIVVVEGFYVEITEEMVAAVEEYRDLIAATLEDIKARKKPMDVVSKSEVELSGEKIDPRLFGTADHLIYRKGDVLHVFDLKYGKGEVEVGTVEKPNKQLATYAVMAMDGEAGWAYDRVTLHIFQPRAKNPDDVHCWVETTPAILKQYREELVLAAQETAKPGAKLVAGDWCSKNYCLARANCKTRHQANVAFAQTDFAVIPATPSSAAALPSLAICPSSNSPRLSGGRTPSTRGLRPQRNAHSTSSRRDARCPATSSCRVAPIANGAMRRKSSPSSSPFSATRSMKTPKLRARRP